MPTNSFIERDYVADARDFIPSRQKNKPVFDKYLQLLLAGSNSVQAELKKLMQLRSLDTATGKQLDVLGAIVGQPRPTVDINTYRYFGFDDDPYAGGFAEQPDVNTPSTGGSPLFEANLVVSDATQRYIDDDSYRLFIRAKILKDSTGISPEEIMDFFDFMFQCTGTTLTELPNSVISIRVAKVLSELEYTFLTTIFNSSYADRLFPKPVGVSVIITDIS